MSKEIVFKSENGEPVTTSKLVAEKFGKRNADILRAIKNLECSDEFKERNFALMVKTNDLPQGGKTDEYITYITRDGFTFLVMGFTGKDAAKFKEDYIRAFNEMEQTIKNNSLPDFNNPVEAARAWADECEQKQQLEVQTKLQQKQLQIAAPKVDYYENVLESKSTYTTTQIAKELGMSATELNNRLHHLKVQYKQRKTWLLYAKYQDKGYTDTYTHWYQSQNGDNISNMQTMWTEKGRRFIHKIIKIKSGQKN